jgi:outer membrane protein assembly factor BamB
MLPLTADDPRMVGEFRLHARLGAGGMGRVFLGHSPGGRAVAVKVVHPHLARDAAFVDRFRREVAAAQAVNGSYAAPVVAAGPDDDPPWLATAYVPGPSLADMVTAQSISGGPLPEDAAMRLTAGLAEALRVIHACGLVHRDLKPGNVLLAPDGPRVIDFGIARALDGTVLTSAESLLGTPSFMSPEQAEGQPAGPASDVFSLGGVVYFAATGANPFGTGHPAVMLYRIVHTEPDLERLPTRLRDLIAACMAKDPARRPSPAELCTALMDVVPPGDSPAAFWPAPVARLIRDHQAGLAMGPPDSGSQSPVTIRVGQTVPESETDPGTGPGMGRRRALAALAGAATGGLAVALWELIGPGTGHGTASGQLTSRHRTSRPGAEIWRAKVNSSVDYLTVAGGVVYAGTAQNAVYALNAGTGKQVWWRATTTTDNGQLVVADGAVVIADPGQGGVLALDAATGHQLWSTTSAGSGGVLGLVADGDRVFCGYAAKSGTTGGVTAFSAAAGTMLWTVEFEQNLDINGGLAAAAGVVYATTSNGEIYAYRAATGTKLWRVHGKGVKFGGNASPLTSGGVVYACSSNNPPVLYAVRAATHRQLWQRSLGASDDATWLAVSDGVLFVGDTGNGPNTGYLGARNAATGGQLWKVPVSGGVFPVAVTAGGVVYSGSNNGVLDAWQANTGSHLWSYSGSNQPIASNMVVAGGVAYYGSNDHHVYAVAAQS